jgi:hypothetical protein
MVNRTIRLFDQRTTTGNGTAIEPHSSKKTFQVLGRTSSGSGACVVKIQGSLVGGTADNEWVDFGTVTLTLTTSGVTDGFASDAAWVYIRPVIVSISGTGASVDVYMGREDHSRFG